MNWILLIPLLMGYLVAGWLTAWVIAYRHPFTWAAPTDTMLTCLMWPFVVVFGGIYLAWQKMHPGNFTDVQLPDPRVLLQQRAQRQQLQTKLESMKWEVDQLQSRNQQLKAELSQALNYAAKLKRQRNMTKVPMPPNLYFPRGEE